MSELPTDLIPLPTAPYDERPAALPLDVEECRTALWLCRGNVSKAADKLKTTAYRLRKFVEKSPRLQEECKEARAQLVDLSEDVAYEALTDEEDANRRDQMARFVLTNLGGERGYGKTGNGASMTLNAPKGKLTIQWGDGSSFDEAEKTPEKVIEHE